jgi:hypothetical protein
MLFDFCFYISPQQRAGKTLLKIHFFLTSSLYAKDPEVIKHKGHKGFRKAEQKTKTQQKEMLKSAGA